MKNTIITLIMFSVFFVGYSQESPKLIIEQSTDGFEISLDIQKLDKISNISIKTEVLQNNISNSYEYNLSSSDLKSNKAFSKISNEASYSEYTVEVTNTDGQIIIYPPIELNIKDAFFASND